MTTNVECRFCGKHPAVDNLLGLCADCWRYHRDRGPGGKAAGAVFEDEPQEMTMAVGK